MPNNGSRLSSRRGAVFVSCIVVWSRRRASWKFVCSTNRRLVETPCVLQIRVFYKSPSRRDAVLVLLQIVVSSRRGARGFYKSSSRRDAVRAVESCFLRIVVSSRRRAFSKLVFCTNRRFDETLCVFCFSGALF